MKTCSYCGQEEPDAAVSCSGCGTEFVESPKDLPGGRFRRPPRPEAGSIVLRSFSQEAPAQQALATLRAARIEAFIGTDDCGGLFPPLTPGRAFRLVISEVHREAAEQVLADMGRQAEPIVGEEAPLDSTKLVDSSRAGAPSTARSLGGVALGLVAGVFLVLGYQWTRETFSGTVERDFNHDGRPDDWVTYTRGQLSRVAMDHNGDEKQDVWYYYEGDVLTKWEEDLNFDGKVDTWGTCDPRSVASQSKADLDFDGNPDVTTFLQFGLWKETHHIRAGSGLVWKKDFYTNGMLREVLLDRDRDGKFDEKFSIDVHGVEVSKQILQ